jgi:hypothetical protein
VGLCIRKILAALALLIASAVALLRLLRQNRIASVEPLLDPWNSSIERVPQSRMADGHLPRGNRMRRIAV